MSTAVHRGQRQHAPDRPLALRNGTPLSVAGCGRGGQRGQRPQPGRAQRRRPRARRRLAGLLRFVLFLALVFAVAWGGVRVANATGQATPLIGEQYVVEAGDSLWSIAVSHYGGTIAPRSAVQSIRQANGLSAEHVLQPGETLLLPGDRQRTASLIE